MRNFVCRYLVVLCSFHNRCIVLFDVVESVLYKVLYKVNIYLGGQQTQPPNLCPGLGLARSGVTRTVAKNVI